MKKRILPRLLFSIFLIFFLQSCNFLASIFTPEKEEGEIGEFEDINIFEASLLPDENSFITGYSIVANENYLYAVTDGKKECPGKVIKVLKTGESPVIKTLVEEAISLGYTDSHAYEIESINYYSNQLVLKAVPNRLQFEHGEFEIFALSEEDLSIQWRWFPDENGRIDYHAAGHPAIPRWNNYFLIYYAEEDKADGFYLVFIDTKGKQVSKRYIQKSRPLEEGDICIVDDKLLLHQKYEPLIIYDLNKLVDLNYDCKECIDFAFTSEDKTYEANLYSNIVTDGNNCYFCSWKILDRKKCESVLVVYAMSLSNCQILWSYEMEDDDFDCVNSILLDNEKLFLAVDYGCVYCLNSNNGKLNWKTKITDVDHQKNLLCEGCIVKDCFVIPCWSDGYLFYFDVNTGKIKGKRYVPVFGGKRHCLVEDDYLYITTGSYITRLRLKDK